MVDPSDREYHEEEDHEKEKERCYYPGCKENGEIFAAKSGSTNEWTNYHYLCPSHEALAKFIEMIQGTR